MKRGTFQSMARDQPRLFSALLKYWRCRRGLSQLDLALAADISSRHLSFLETGRARPSREMVLRLGTALEVPLRDQNAMLHALGLPPQFEEQSPAAGWPAWIENALARMQRQHEPFPLTVLNRGYDVVQANHGAARLFARFTTDPGALEQPLNVVRLLFDPNLGRRFVVNWDRVARDLLSRLHRESLMSPGDETLASLVKSVLEYPGVPAEWRQPDFAAPSEPTLALHLRLGDLELRFLTTITVFSAPQNVTLEELRIESYFPLDEATEHTCKQLESRNRVS